LYAAKIHTNNRHNKFRIVSNNSTLRAAEYERAKEESVTSMYGARKSADCKAPLEKETNMNARGTLRRSRRNRMIAGVCGGLAEFLGISSFWVRLGFFILLLPGGLPGLVPYLVLWVVIPKE
jgi:phage shock protein C